MERSNDKIESVSMVSTNLGGYVVRSTKDRSIPYGYVHQTNAKSARSRKHTRQVRHRQRLRRKILWFTTVLGVGVGFWALSHVYHIVRHLAPLQHPNSSNFKVKASSAGSSEIANRSTLFRQSSSDATQKLQSIVHTPTPNVPLMPNKAEILHKMMRLPLPTSALLQVSAQSQLPQLHNGCEVTSLSMLMAYMKHPVSKMTLAHEEPTDNTPMVMKNHQIVSWGNPNVGFVGSVTGDKKYGFGIYHGPLTKLVNKILPNRGVDLTGSPFRYLETIVAGGTPIVVWTTYTFKPTNVWTTWKTPEGPLRATMQEHAVLLVGYNQDDVFLNNPANGASAQKVPIQPFIEAWDQLGKQAVTITPTKYTMN